MKWVELLRDDNEKSKKEKKANAFLKNKILMISKSDAPNQSISEESTESSSSISLMQVIQMPAEELLFKRFYMNTH